MAQMAWILTNCDGTIIKRKRRIISPEGTTCPMGTVSQYGISVDTAECDGVSLSVVLSEFADDFKQAKRLVGHNIEFHKHVVGAEMIRRGDDITALMQMDAVCTMTSSTDLCMLQPMVRGKYKWPKLTELHDKLFGYSFDKNSDISTLLDITKNCYMELVRRGAIEAKVRNVIEQGTCGQYGDNIKYELTDVGELVIYGTGETRGYVWDGSLFYKSPFYKREDIKEVIIKEGVTVIGSDAFCGCLSLTSITIPDSVTVIGQYAFRRCTSLTSITIPDSVTKIGGWAFNGCTSLTSITIPDSVTEIGVCAFEGCTSLTSITIPDSVTSIGQYAFEDCTSLTSITIPDSVTKIGHSAFRNCTSLTSITIPDSVTEIGGYVFYGCTSLTSITIPDSVTEIGDRAFGGCSSLTSITIFDSVTEIGEYAFRGCTSLTSIILPDGVIKIGEGLFYDCTSLTSITIPDSVTEIGDWAFNGCIYNHRTTKTNQKYPSVNL